MPAKNLIGEENQGFLAIMINFASERLFLAAQCVAHGLSLVTANAREFARVPALMLEDWRA